MATTADRTRHATRFAPVFTTAADLAVALGDHDAADVIMEATRRDRVGLILAELARNPEVDTAIRSAALAITDSSTTTPTPDTSSGAGEEEDSPPPPGPTMGKRSAEILVDRRQAVSDAERVLGPLGALCDTASLMSITAAAVLQQRTSHTAPTAILQLLPHHTPARTTADAPQMVTVCRRLTWTATGSTVHEHLDTVTIPAHLLELTAGDQRIFGWAGAYTKAVLPQQFIDLVQHADTHSPVRLMIVPTGMFHVPFDALPIPIPTTQTNRSTTELLIDRAVISVHGSLTSMLALMRINTLPSLTPSIAVYGGTAAKPLNHVEAEYESLKHHIPDVTRVHGAGDLTAHLSTPATDEPVAMLAMGVHGSNDEHGWGQGKQMPDGSTVTAAQALRWTVPRLCVLASCHSAITTGDGVELGGFPLALMLRGASTVIGGLYAINDEATTDIMSHFWNHYAAGVLPLHALHTAKTEWLHNNPHHRDSPKLWAGLIAYGAATN